MSIHIFHVKIVSEIASFIPVLKNHYQQLPDSKCLYSPYYMTDTEYTKPLSLLIHFNSLPPCEMSMISLILYEGRVG